MAITNERNLRALSVFGSREEVTCLLADLVRYASREEACWRGEIGSEDIVAAWMDMEADNAAIR